MITQCKLCNSYNNKKLFIGKDKIHNIKGYFSVYQCCKCGVIYNDPFLSQEAVSKYYPIKIINQENIILNNSQIKKLYIDVSKKNKLIKKYKKNGNLIDIGCNEGRFLHGMKIHGWESLYGVEPNKQIAEIANNYLNIKIINNFFPGDFDVDRFEGKKFDVITFWHVFEHIDNPIQALKEIYNLMANDGICIINIPNPDSRQRKFFKVNWFGYDIPRHYFSYPPSTFRELVNKNGFEIIEEGILDRARGEIMVSLNFIASNYSGILRKVICIGIRILSSSLSNIVLSPIWFILEKYIFKGSSRFYILKKIKIE
jgi:2-polyprenyl-3-methyl-5-hydroxy-6-metoxy-1,4-benzoquinol methylase